MINKVLLAVIILIYLYCLFYKSDEKFTENKNIKKQIMYGLEVIDKIFNKYNIYYTAAYGTLLGTIRHWDMIPWDDDADLNIWIKDYKKILSLKNEFKSYGLILETDWKLIKIYFDDTKYPFIDLFINDIEDGKVVRCSEPFDNKCTKIDKINDWWWNWINYPADWIKDRKRLKFGSIELWCPKESDKVLKYWYGKNYLTECKTPEINHTSSEYIKSKNIWCGILPNPQF